MQILASFFFIALFASMLVGQPSRFPVESGNGEWYVDSADRSGDVRFADFAGRRAMWLRNNTQVMRSDLEFTDGTIEFEVAPMEKGNFVGILFRRESGTSHENIYLRFHRSGLYNAIQYAPRINGSSTWQLYPEFNAKIDLPRLSWTRVRVEVTGQRLDVFINGGSAAVLSVNRLRGVPKKGSVAFWGRVNDKPAEWAAALSNISIRPRNEATGGPTTRSPIEIDSAFLTRWEAADAGSVQGDIAWDASKEREWQQASAEENGLINLNRLFSATRGRRTAFVRTYVESGADASTRLELGYSDDVVVILNGSIVYRGINGFESRHPEYMGFVKPGFENVSLNLRRGRNELVLAITDGQIFGWGFVARLVK